MKISTLDGLVNVGETVRFRIGNDKAEPASLTIYERYLEKQRTQRRMIPLLWAAAGAGFEALVEYTPEAPGNYYAEVGAGSQMRTAYFGVWAPGIAVQTLWMFFTSAYHARGNLTDFYGPEFLRYHLPADLEICTIGEEFLRQKWHPMNTLKRAHRSTSCKVYPFLDFATAEDFVPELAGTRGGEKGGMLPDPTAHNIGKDDIRKFLRALQEHWKKWSLAPFDMVGHYTPSNALVEACAEEGILGIDSVFSEHDFNDGGPIWDYGWRQNHFGIPNFPYYPRKEDFRKAGPRDEHANPVMIFPADLRHPVLSHAGYVLHSNDMSIYVRFWTSRNPLTGETSIDVNRTLDKYIEMQESMYNAIAANPTDSPVVINGLVEFGEDEHFGIVAGNRMILQYFANRGRSGQVIFAHKADVARYFARHLAHTPDRSYIVHDYLADLVAPQATMPIMKDEPGFDQFGPKTGKPAVFPETLVWCGEAGKASFLKRAILDEPAQNADIAPKPTVTIEPPHKGSPWLPFWWYDYRQVQNAPATRQMELVDLSGFRADLRIDRAGGTAELTIDAPRGISGLPVCLWDLDLTEKGMPASGMVTKDGVGGFPATLLFMNVNPGINRFRFPH